MRTDSCNWWHGSFYMMYWNASGMHETWHICEWVVAHIWMSHGTYMNESAHKTGHDSLYMMYWSASTRIVSCFICTMTHSYMCHDSFITDNMIHFVWCIGMHPLESCPVLYVPWLIHICAMTHSYMCHDSFIYVPCLIHICAMTHSYMCHDPFRYVPWLIHIYAQATNDMIHCIWCIISLFCKRALLKRRCWYIWMTNVAIFIFNHNTNVDMGWLWLVGSLKL